MVPLLAVEASSSIGLRWQSVVGRQIVWNRSTQIADTDST
jgi:hypothetical protein